MTLKTLCWLAAANAVGIAATIHFDLHDHAAALMQGAMIQNSHLDIMLYHHERQVSSFVGAPGFGAFRVVLHMPGIHGLMNPAQGSWWEDDISFDLDAVELVGLTQHEIPRVYDAMRKRLEDERVYLLAKGPPTPKSVEQLARHESHYQSLQLPDLPLSWDSHGPSRELDVFEKSAVDLLRKGHALVRKDSGDRIRAVGAIRATQTCLKCHDTLREGDLLGAFTYFGRRQPEASRESRAKRKALLAGLQEGVSAPILLERVGRPGYVDSPTDAEALQRLCERYGIVTQAMYDTLITSRNRHINSSESAIDFGEPPPPSTKRK